MPVSFRQGEGLAMSSAKVLIIDASGDCAFSAAKALMPEGIAVLAACGRDKARRMLAVDRPDLIVADCSVECNPLVWVEEVHRLALPAQVIAVTGEPDFRRAMDWVAGGVFNVLTHPLDESRLRDLALAALENQAAFKSILRSGDEPESAASGLFRSLASFYHGLAGRLDGADLKKYVIDSVKMLTGALRVELSLVEDMSGSSYCLETHAINFDRKESAPPRGLDDSPIAEAVPDNCRLSFEMRRDERHLGEIRLYFADKDDAAIAGREILAEIVSAASAALGSAVKYQKAVNLASRDGLTGLYNRRTFNEVLKREFAQARRHRFSLSLLSLDLDHFKSVNDNFGHQTGDLVLKSVAEVITKVARATDLPARVGGEEFAIILPHTSQDQAYIVAERLRNILAESAFNLSGAVFRQTVSQGVTGLEHFMIKSAEDMVYWADQALYLAKREGRDTIRTASDLSIPPVIKDGPYAFQ